jgi:hypothetical protein
MPAGEFADLSQFGRRKKPADGFHHQAVVGYFLRQILAAAPRREGVIKQPSRPSKTRLLTYNSQLQRK